ncbi:MAG TPA: YbbR-like domain-containing protein, partial [Pyrinomonadaceae bacterium]|nr:YbbR-like domain-containing protein [Pyrinomonadaceae bacterium]
VEPKLEGKPADGFEVYSVYPNKGSVAVRGPASRVNALQKVATESVWLAGHKESFTAANVALDVPDPKVDLLEPMVNVEVEIGERRIEKTFSNVPVTTNDGSSVQPATTSVTLLGVAAFMDALKPGELKIILEGQNREPRLDLPDALKGKIVLKSVNTSRFVPVK